MALLKKLKASTILENIVASVILLTVFILAGNAINSVFKTSLDRRDLKFDNQVRKMEYLILNDKIRLPQLIKTNNHTASFRQENDLLIMEIHKYDKIIKTKCCLPIK
jgi:hypothetical protein